ncbi:MAG: hypothetical protein MZV63_64260 [Marinilabiliales bacterium]|nr:hypothetical protein [Marinilabiliales bacterium]
MMTLLPVSAVAYIFSTVLTAAGSFKLLGIITLSGMVLNIMLNCILIPLTLRSGAASTALVTQLFMALACVVAAEKTMFRMLNTRRVLLYLIMLLLTFAAGSLLRLTGMPWIASAAIQLLTGLAVALAFRMVEPLKSLKLIVERPDSI